MSSVEEVAVRELEFGEADVVAEVFDGLTAEQRHHRFHTGVTRLTKAMLDHLSSPDGSAHVALVATSNGHPVGLARYVSFEKGHAEVAVEVAQRYTGRGLGRLLLRRLLTRAIANGVCRLDITVTSDNRAALRLASLFGVRLEPHAGGYSGTLSLERRASTASSLARSE